MIAHIKGKILYLNPSYVILDIGNIGYEIKISLNTFTELKNSKECSLFTHLQIKEDSHTLFGFINKSEKSSFLELLSVKGVGPNAALSILSALGVEDLINAIATDSVSVIKSVKGIGLKISQRIVLELKDKLSHLIGEKYALGDDAKDLQNIKEEGLAALTKLGISKNIAEKSINDIIRKHGKNIDVETLIKLSLKP